VGCYKDECFLVMDEMRMSEWSNVNRDLYLSMSLFYV
jgi:hypothetical protein